MTRTAYVNIGSNIGDSMALIGRAVAAIGRRFGAVRASRPVVSKPWGFESSNDFVNVGVVFTTDLPPDQLLEELLEIQDAISTTAHRNADGTYRDRQIDIDLIALDWEIRNSPALTLPHPRMALRPFVLEPLAELWPQWRHPLTGLTASAMLSLLDETQS